MKKLISLLLLFVAITVLATGCTIQGTISPKNDTTIAENSDYEENTVNTTEELRLSDSCDVVLASGYDEKNNFYELVANQAEDYSGVKIEMGVIKNNEWLLELTSDIPFVRDNGSLQNGKGLDDSMNCFYYIGKGTFLFSYNCKFNSGTVSRTIDVVYNSVTKKSYVCDDEHISLVKYEDYSTGQQIFTDPNCDYIIIKEKRYSGDYTLTLLDFVTMETKELKLSYRGFPADTDCMYPISDGVIVIVGGHHIRFYDTDGNMTFDSDFEYINTPYDGYSFVMQDGKCSFSVENNNGTIYNVTLNKKGEVISQGAVE